MVASALFSVVLAGLRAIRALARDRRALASSDAKMAADKIAEAEPLYEGREDMTKARSAVDGAPAGSGR